jgi:hypothetical protein
VAASISVLRSVLNWVYGKGAAPSLPLVCLFQPWLGVFPYHMSYKPP